MAEFQPITTQEEFDAAVKERLKRAEEKYSKKYEGYISPDEMDKTKKDYDAQIADLNNAISAAKKKAEKFDADLAERDSKIKAYETSAIKSRVAHEVGLSYDSIEFLKGEDEASIKESAEALKGLIGQSAPTTPLATEDKPSSILSSSDTAMRSLARGLMGQD